MRGLQTNYMAYARGVPDLWTFPEGAVGHSDSVKAYRVDGSDGSPVGTVAWADYKPGDSYLVVDVDHGRQHLVPAGAITSVDHDGRALTLNVTAEQVRATAPYEETQRSFVDAETNQVDQFERGMLGGGFVWPYTDV
jgi:hypothetical protein